jgi:hypothetical protein
MLKINHFENLHTTLVTCKIYNTYNHILRVQIPSVAKLSYVNSIDAMIMQLDILAQNLLYTKPFHH